MNWSGPTTDDGNSTNMHWRIVGSSGRGVRSGYAHMREQIRRDHAILELGASNPGCAHKGARTTLLTTYSVLTMAPKMAKVPQQLRIEDVSDLE